MKKTYHQHIQFKQVLVLCFFALFNLSLNGQTASKTENRLDGIWVGRNTSGEITKVFSIKGDDIIEYVNQDGNQVSFSEYQKTQDLNFNKKSYQLKNNGTYIWTSTCETCIWTETQFKHFSLIQDNTIVLHWKRIVDNNKNGEDCYLNNRDCFTNEETSILTRYRKVTVGKTPSFDYISLDNIYNTEEYTVVELIFLNNNDSINGTLHKPNGEHPYILSDKYGNRYALKSQEGWGGSESEGFGSIVIPAGQRKLVRLYFSKITKLENVYSLTEVGCAEQGGNCWDFINIKF